MTVPCLSLVNPPIEIGHSLFIKFEIDIVSYLVLLLLRFI